MNEVRAVVEAFNAANVRVNGTCWQQWAVWKGLRTVALVRGCWSAKRASVPERSVPGVSKLTLSNTRRTSSERARRSSSSTIPLSNRTTVANGSEREQVLPLLDRVKLKTLKRGRPRKRIKVSADDKGYNSKQQRVILRKRVLDLKYQNEFGRLRKTKVDRSKSRFLDVSSSDVSLLFNVNTVVWLYARERRKVCFDAFIDLATIYIWTQRILLVG